MNENLKAPYTPVEHVIKVIHTLRSRGFQGTITRQYIGQLGVPDGSINPSLQALHWLGLLDEQKRPTPEFQQIVRVSDEEYRKLLGDIIRRNYANIFAAIEPSTDAPDKVADAFRYYDPLSQKSRMIAFFRGLCQEAGIITTNELKTVKRTQNFKARKTSQSIRPSRQQSITNNIAENLIEKPNMTDLRPLQGLFELLPDSRRWTPRSREKWLKIFNSALDYIVEVEEVDE